MSGRCGGESSRGKGWSEGGFWVTPVRIGWLLGDINTDRSGRFGGENSRVGGCRA